MNELEIFVWEKCGSPMTPQAGVFRKHEVYPAEITLAHVLNSCQELFDTCSCHRGFFYFCFYEKYIDWEQITPEWSIEWDLTKNFHEQSLETKQAIAKLLGWEG